MARASIRMKGSVAFLLVGVCALVSGCADGGRCAAREPVRVVLRYEWLGDIDEEGFREPSGIVFDGTRGTLFVIGDEGDICEMTTDGQMLRQKALRRGADLEGLARVPETGLLYVAVEGDEKILEVDPGTFEVKREFAIPRTFRGTELFKPGGQGIEGICFVPREGHAEGGTFFVANQSFTEEPGEEMSLIAEVELPLRSSPDATNVEIRSWFPVPVIDIAALHYDQATGHILAVSDSANALLELTLDGEAVRVLTLTGDNQEGLTLDDEGLVYIAQDSGGIIKIRPHWPQDP